MSEMCIQFVLIVSNRQKANCRKWHFIIRKHKNTLYGNVLFSRCSHGDASVGAFVFFSVWELALYKCMNMRVCYHTAVTPRLLNRIPFHGWWTCGNYWNFAEPTKSIVHPRISRALMAWTIPMGRKIQHTSMWPTVTLWNTMESNRSPLIYRCFISPLLFRLHTRCIHSIWISKPTYIYININRPFLQCAHARSYTLSTH